MKKCIDCWQFQENLVTEGGMCNLHGFELHSEKEVQTVYCNDFESKDSRQTGD